MNCVRHHAFLSVPKVSDVGAKASNLRAFAGLRAARCGLCRPAIARRAVLGLLSLAFWKPFLALCAVRDHFLEQLRLFLGSQPEYRVLFRPFGWRVAQSSNADAAR